MSQKIRGSFTKKYKLCEVNMLSKLSKVMVSSILGHSGGGMFPLTLLPDYCKFLSAVKQNEIYNISKSATRHARIGNLIMYYPWTWKYVQKLENNGLLNAYGLTNPGVAACAKKIKNSCELGFNVIPSFYLELSLPLHKAIARTSRAMKIYRNILGNYFEALELNLSCPNSGEDITKNMKAAIVCIKEIKKEYPSLFLIAKLSIVHPYEFAQELELVGVNMLHAINTIPFNFLFPHNKSPLYKVGGGGVSGGPAKDSAMEYNRGLRKQVKLPLMMGCGIMNFDDANYYLDIIGADHIVICTVVRCDTTEAIEIVEKLS
jgi:dihydroorotate dehydrogenase